IVWISPKLVEGGYVGKDEKLFQIDPADYEIQIQQSKANLARAQYDLAMAEAQKQTAEQSMKYFDQSKGKQSVKGNNKMSELARHQPQMKNARASVDSAKASLKMARLNLDRARVTAPFNGYLYDVNLTVGQIVSIGQSVVKMFPETPVVLKVSIPLSDLGWVELDKLNSQNTPKAIISRSIGKEKHEWQGKVVRHLLQMDPASSLSTLIVEVDKPISQLGFRLPLGMLADVTIKGKTLKKVNKIPLDSLRDNDRLFIFNDNKLEIRQVEVIRKNDQFAFISSGLQKDDFIIVSPLTSIVPGMKLKIFDPEDKEKTEITKQNPKKETRLGAKP
ncbi:MAG: efflux RND transporter periplasmic adaptor subunit, partial [Deltaproteobacteria bacterium]|nr:efflux RND transporter periplasmic adaptor subunit [Deltaproteobacteria bacterium]